MFCHKYNVLDLLNMRELILRSRSEWATLQIVFFHSIDLYWKLNQNTTLLSPLLFEYLKLTGLIWSAELWILCVNMQLFLTLGTFDQIFSLVHTCSLLLSRSQTYSQTPQEREITNEISLTSPFFLLDHSLQLKWVLLLRRVSTEISTLPQTILCFDQDTKVCNFSMSSNSF